MINIYINQKRNNLFFNIFNEKKKKIYYSSIGLEFSNTNISSPLIDYFIHKMFLRFNYLLKKNYYSLKWLRKKVYGGDYKLYFLINYDTEKHTLLKKRIFIFLYLNILNNFDYFTKSLNKNLIEFKIQFTKIIFLNKFSHSGNNFKFRKWWK